MTFDDLNLFRFIVNRKEQLYYYFIQKFRNCNIKNHVINKLNKYLMMYKREFSFRNLSNDGIIELLFKSRKNKILKQ
jgi:hypothetical protein